MNKTQLIEIIEMMPDEILVDDFIAELYFKEKLGKGLHEIEEGKLVDHEEVKNRLSKWLK